MSEFKERQYSFKGKTYNVAYVDLYPSHPSWFTHEDEASVRDAQWDIRPGECILDVGAAYGSYSLAALSAGAAMVYAWSPQGEVGLPSESVFFAESLRLNGWQDKCEIYKCGVYDKDGWLNAMTQAFQTTPPEEFNNDIIQVSCLDSWYERSFSTVRKKSDYTGFWLKLDVEGAEVEVLNGAVKLISDLRPKIQVENHNFKKASLEQEVRSLLTSMNYREMVTTPYHAVSHSVYYPV